MIMIPVGFRVLINCPWLYEDIYILLKFHLYSGMLYSY